MRRAAAAAEIMCCVVFWLMVHAWAAGSRSPDGCIRVIARFDQLCLGELGRRKALPTALGARKVTRPATVRHDGLESSHSIHLHPPHVAMHTTPKGERRLGQRKSGGWNHAQRTVANQLQRDMPSEPPTHQPARGCARWCSSEPLTIISTFAPRRTTLQLRPLKNCRSGGLLTLGHFQ
jgi:hypothetical protein